MKKALVFLMSIIMIMTVGCADSNSDASNLSSSSNSDPAPIQNTASDITPSAAITPSSAPSTPVDGDQSETENYEGYIESVNQAEMQFTIAALGLDGNDDFEAVGLDTKSTVIQYAADTVITLALSNNQTETTETMPGSVDELLPGKYVVTLGKEFDGIVTATKITIFETVG